MIKTLFSSVVILLTFTNIKKELIMNWMDGRAEREH